MRLPISCELDYYEDFLAPEECAPLYDLITSELEGHDVARLPLADGSFFEVDFEKLMFVDQELVENPQFPVEHGARIEWPDFIKPLKEKIERFTHTQFNVCVCIRYPTGDSAAGFHSDFPSFGSTSLIPSISLGAERRFVFRKKADHSDEYALELASGSLLLMGKGCQEEYEHSLAVDTQCKEPRINLTFRPFGDLKQRHVD